MSRPACPCCANEGVLPGAAVVNSARALTQLVPGEVAAQMCDECLAAAFLSSNGVPAHPHPIKGSP